MSELAGKLSWWIPWRSYRRAAERRLLSLRRPHDAVARDLRALQITSRRLLDPLAEERRTAAR